MQRGTTRPLALAAILPLLLFTASSCTFSRGVKDMTNLPPSDARFAVEAPCAPSDAQRVVESSARELELDIESSSQRPGEPWVFLRGRRLADPQLLFRVDIEPIAERPSASTVRVYALPVPILFTDTHESMAKPGALAMRIVAACAAGGAP